MGLDTLTTSIMALLRWFDTVQIIKVPDPTKKCSNLILKITFTGCPVNSPRIPKRHNYQFQLYPKVNVHVIKQ